ncbi:MAG: hypothetical protein ABI181_15385 [Mycobacteriaceae bacterium]
MTTTPRSPEALVALLAGAGVAHLARPQLFDPMVPASLPGSARRWTLGSGVAELGCAALLAVRRTRRLGALSSAALFVGVFPANVSMALRSRGSSRGARIAVWSRLPLQVPLVVWALRLSAHREPRPRA